MRILETQDKHAKLIEAQAADITSLREAMLTLQAREDVLIARAELAAMKAATEATTDQARRIDTLRPAPAGTHKTRRFRNVGQFASRHIDCSGDLSVYARSLMLDPEVANSLHDPCVKVSLNTDVGLADRHRDLPRYAPF